MQNQEQLLQDSLLLAQIDHVLKKRREINPLEFFEPLELQKSFEECPAKIKGVFGGNRCLVGESLIYDPVYGGLRRLDSIGSRFHVFAIDEYGNRQISVASKPFIKGFEAMYEVKLSNGESFICSSKHQILTCDGYRSVSSILPSCRLSRAVTISEPSQAAHVSSGQNYVQKVQDYQDDCFAYSRQCDGQLHQELNSDQAFSPSPIDVQERIFCEVCERTDAQDNTPKNNHACQSIAHRATQGAQPLSEALFFGILSHASCIFYKLTFQQAFLSILTVVLSIVGFFLQRSRFEFARLDTLDDCAKPYSITSDLVVISISYKRHDLVWDISVPGFNNYELAGAIHHNSGKTQIGAKYVIDKCLKSKIRVWVCAETEEMSVSVQQRKIWELLPKNQTKYAYYDDINGFRNGKVTFKNGSYIRFKTYKQGQIAFASDDIDLIWDDEEPAYEIYQEQRMRLVDRNGELIFTMTALKGVTELVADLYDDHDVIKTQHAALLGEDLPRIIEKNGAKFFMLWTTENKFIDQDRLRDDVKMMDRSEIRSRIYGIPVNMSGRIYPSFNKLVHVVSEDRLPKRLVTLYHILDPHDRKPWAMSWIAVDKTNTAYVIREYPWKKNFNDMESDDKTYDEYVAEIKSIESEIFDIYGRFVYKRIIDPNFGNKTVQLAERKDGNSKTSPVKELRARGLKFEDGLDNIEVGHLQVRKALNWQKKDDEIIVQPSLFVFEECENHIRHLSRYSWKDIDTADGDVKAKPQITQKYKDFCDLVRYGSMAGLRYIERKPQQVEEAVRRY